MLVNPTGGQIGDGEGIGVAVFLTFFFFFLTGFLVAFVVLGFLVAFEVLTFLVEELEMEGAVLCEQLADLFVLQQVEKAQAVRVHQEFRVLRLLPVLQVV